MHKTLTLACTSSILTIIHARIMARDLIKISRGNCNLMITSETATVSWLVTIFCYLQRLRNLHLSYLLSDRTRVANVLRLCIRVLSLDSSASKSPREPAETKMISTWFLLSYLSVVKQSCVFIWTIFHKTLFS